MKEESSALENMQHPNNVRVFSLLLFTAAALCFEPASAVVTASYNTSLSVNTTIEGITDGAGVPLTTLPTDLSILGTVLDQTGSGFFSLIRGPNTPSAFTTSSFSASGDTIVGAIRKAMGHYHLALATVIR